MPTYSQDWPRCDGIHHDLVTKMGISARILRAGDEVEVKSRLEIAQTLDIDGTLDGLASFSLYMVHAPILRMVKGICLRLGWEIHSWTAYGFVTAAMFVVVQSVALVVHRGYELPLQRRLRSSVSFTPAHQFQGALSTHE